MGLNERGGTKMALKITDCEVGGVAVLTLEGRIMLGEETVRFREKVNEVVAAGKKKIVLNLGDVNYIDSSGIGELVSAFTTTKNRAS